MTSHDKPEGPYVVRVQTLCVMVTRLGEHYGTETLGVFWLGDYQTQADARRHAEDFAEKLNREAKETPNGTA